MLIMSKLHADIFSKIDSNISCGKKKITSLVHIKEGAFIIFIQRNTRYHSQRIGVLIYVVGIPDLAIPETGLKKHIFTNTTPNTKTTLIDIGGNALSCFLAHL